MTEQHLLRIKDVVTKTTLSRTTIYRLVADGKFPAPTRLSHRVSVWQSLAVEQWMEETVAR